MRNFLLALLLALPADRTAAGERLLVYAAASTRDALEAVGQAFAAEDGVAPVFSFAASSNLARQIENGAPAALFLSADVRWMDYLAERGLIVADSRRDLLGNSLVLVAPADRPGDADPLRPGSLAAFLGDGKLAMADPDHVPAGRYGKAALESLGHWRGVAAQVVRTQDVRAALALVARGEAAAGIVYRSDAMQIDAVRVVAPLPEASHPPIVYPVALLSGQDSEAARRFLAFLAGPTARQIFESFGFTAAGAGAELE